MTLEQRIAKLTRRFNAIVLRNRYTRNGALTLHLIVYEVERLTARLLKTKKYAGRNPAIGRRR